MRQEYRHVALVFLAIFVPALSSCRVHKGGVATPSEEDLAKSSTKLDVNSRWEVVSLEGNVGRVPLAVGVEAIFGSGVWTVGNVEPYSSIHFTTHDTREYKHIDFWGLQLIEEGLAKTTIETKGIYRLSDERLEICWTEGKDRPTDFVATGGRVLVVFHKVTNRQ